VATRTVSARTLWVAIAITFVVGAAVIVLLLRASDEKPAGRPEFRTLSKDSTATVGYAGAIPSVEESALPRPLGLVGDGSTLYVALADAGAIGVFGYDGSREGTIQVAAAEGAAGSTPVDLALLSDGRLAVVDTAGRRVLLVDPEDPRARGEEFGGGAGPGRILEPTAVEAADGLIYVGDASDGSVREYSEYGDLLRTMSIDAPLPSFIGGLHASGGRLYVSDSNADRVIIVDLRDARQSGVLQRRLGLPRGVAVTGAGEVMVAETFGRRVSVFDPTGASVIDMFPDSNTADAAQEGMLQSPESLVWDERTARVYVTDAVDGRIKIYNYRGGS